MPWRNVRTCAGAPDSFRAARMGESVASLVMSQSGTGLPLRELTVRFSFREPQGEEGVTLEGLRPAPSPPPPSGWPSLRP